MKMIYTHQNRFIVANARNILESHGIDIFLKNEHAGSAAGELSPFDAWLELWVTLDKDYNRACDILEHALSNKEEAPWICASCGEENDVSFDFCWNCGQEQPPSLEN